MLLQGRFLSRIPIHAERCLPLHISLTVSPRVSISDAFKVKREAKQLHLPGEKKNLHLTY